MIATQQTIDAPESAAETVPVAPGAQSLRTFSAGSSGPDSVGDACFHCGLPCRETVMRKAEKAFCCQGCLTVFELLSENGLTGFYQLGESAGVRVRQAPAPGEFAFLDQGEVRERMLDFTDGKCSRVTFHIPAIHCIACVWLLENLFRLRDGVGSSQVNFPRKEVAIQFQNDRVKLSEVVMLLTSLGYEPELKLSDLEENGKRAPVSRRLWLQLGIAGFAFGNLMLLSISGYLGLDGDSGPGFKSLAGYLSLILSIPVVIYSALDYWRSAWFSLRQRLLNIEVPIAAGIVAIFGQSAFEVLSGRGEGYFDSLCGLIFFLLCGRLFQQKTFDRLSFERDYKSFFPLSVARECAGGEERIALAQLQVDDVLIIRNGELIPADARVVDGNGLIDYSFVTGESEPLGRNRNDYVYAGGRQMGGAIRVQTVKPVSQSYLTSLWNQEAFRKGKGRTLRTLTNLYSYRFTKIICVAAVGAALFWTMQGDPARGVKAFVSILIVACPCALALAAPFTLGTAIRVLGRRKVFVKSPEVIEALAKVDAVVFDKTGTLTALGAGSVAFHGADLTRQERGWIRSLARLSTHPLAVRLTESMASGPTNAEVRSFAEKAGCGIEGIVAGHDLALGSAAWLGGQGVAGIPEHSGGSVVHVALDGQYRGAFTLSSAVRVNAAEMLGAMSQKYQLALLSGDHDRERERFEGMFGAGAGLHFQQSPLGKFEFVRDLQRRGRTVMMVGDGLNDAGALKQSDVGVAVVEHISAFSPASDVIMSATEVEHLHSMMRFSKSAVRVVRLSFLVSSIYNVAGLSIAGAGLLAPIVCAILMPLSSITVVAVACGLTTWTGRRCFGAMPPSTAPRRIS